MGGWSGQRGVHLLKCEARSRYCVGRGEVERWGSLQLNAGKSFLIQLSQGSDGSLLQPRQLVATVLQCKSTVSEENRERQQTHNIQIHGH